MEGANMKGKGLAGVGLLLAVTIAAWVGCTATEPGPAATAK